MKHYFYSLFNTLKLKVKGAYITHIQIPLAYRWTSKLRILSDFDSIQYVLDHHCSVSRYGDGEFGILRGIGNGFQSPNSELANRLAKILESDPADHKNFMIGIPLPIKDLVGLKNPKCFWPFVAAENLSIFRKYLNRNKLYLNTQMTRFYFEKADKSNCKRQLSMLQAIYAGRNILVVEGKQSRTGVGNDLYYNAKRVRRILCPSVNAFDRYDEILSTIKRLAEPEELILLSLGMTATVLAYDLAQAGFWAIDFGHVDLEYEWFKRGMDERCSIEGKFVQEVIGGSKNIAECSDPKYLEQIICDLS